MDSTFFLPKFDHKIPRFYLFVFFLKIFHILPIHLIVTNLTSFEIRLCYGSYNWLFKYDKELFFNTILNFRLDLEYSEIFFIQINLGSDILTELWDRDGCLSLDTNFWGRMD